MRPSVPDVRITDPHDAELAAYRALPGQAVLSLIFALLAPLAFVDPTLWTVPLLGVIFSHWALRRIWKYAPAMVGRKMALTGLTLSLLILTAAPTHWYVYRWMVSQEARQFGALWFKYLAQDEPQKAYQLMISPQERQPMDDRLWDFYRRSVTVRGLLEGNVRMPVIRTLLALGPGAHVRFYQVTDQWTEKQADNVDVRYAVTYEEKNERKSFFVTLELSRAKLPKGGAGWWIVRFGGGGNAEG